MGTIIIFFTVILALSFFVLKVIFKIIDASCEAIVDAFEYALSGIGTGITVIVGVALIGGMWSLFVTEGIKAAIVCLLAYAILYLVYRLVRLFFKGIIQVAIVAVENLLEGVQDFAELCASLCDRGYNFCWNVIKKKVNVE